MAMATAQVAVPRGVERIVLIIDNGEVEELRARLKDAEVHFWAALPDRFLMRWVAELECYLGGTAVAATKPLRGIAGTPCVGMYHASLILSLRPSIQG